MISSNYGARFNPAAISPVRPVSQYAFSAPQQAFSMPQQGISQDPGQLLLLMLIMTIFQMLGPMLQKLMGQQQQPKAGSPITSSGGGHAPSSTPHAASPHASAPYSGSPKTSSPQSSTPHGATAGYNSSAKNQDGGINLDLAGWNKVNESTGYVTYNGDVDPNAPSLANLFADGPRAIQSTYRVNEWQNGQVLGEKTKWPVSMVGYASQPGEDVLVPYRGPAINANGDVARVTYADENSLVLQYTKNPDGSDNKPVTGYSIHLQNVQPNADILQAYQAAEHGQCEFPEVKTSQPVGKALGGETLVAVRDSGEFMDPRDANFNKG